MNGNWERLETHRRKAGKYRLAALVWGPSSDGSPESQARSALLETLRRNGHDACFSEELCGGREALPDPLEDQVLQVHAADVVLMIYGSRGTQSERDTILTLPWLCHKIIVFITDSMLETILEKSVAAESWRQMIARSRVLTYTEKDLPEAVLAPAIEMTELMRRSCYVRDLRLGGFQ